MSTRLDSPKEKSTKHNKKKPNTTHFNIYIREINKQIYPDLQLQPEIIEILDNIINVIGKKIVENSVLIMKTNKKETMSLKFLKLGTELSISGEIQKHATFQALKATSKALTKNATTDPHKKRETLTKKTGLVFPPARVERVIMRKVSCVKRIPEGAPVYLAAVLEYICADLLDYAGRITIDKYKASRITVPHLSLAVENDSELKKLIHDAHIHIGRANMM